MANLKLGLAQGYWSAAPHPDFVAMAQEAERLGFDSVWSAEAWGNDAFTPLCWIGAQTEKIKLGTAVVQLSGRTPTSCAMHALSLDYLSNGRFMLGLGVSGPQVVEGWYGQPFPRPLERTRTEGCRWSATMPADPQCSAAASRPTRGHNKQNRPGDARGAADAISRFSALC